MTSWGSSPTGALAMSLRVAGSTMARVWSCLERMSRDSRGADWAGRVFARGRVRNATSKIRVKIFVDMHSLGRVGWQYGHNLSCKGKKKKKITQRGRERRASAERRWQAGHNYMKSKSNAGMGGGKKGAACCAPTKEQETFAALRNSVEDDYGLAGTGVNRVGDGE